VSRLILGIDEGTSAVKAALFDERLEVVAKTRRDKVSYHPRAGWVEQDAEAVLAAVVAVVGELLADAPGEVVACGLDHQGESVLAWDAVSGAALTPIVTWQDKRSTTILDRLAPDEQEIRRRSGLPLDPYFSAGKLAWLLEEHDAVAGARNAGTLRMGTVDAFLCDRLGAGFATDASTASRTQLQALGSAGFDPWLCERFAIPTDVLPVVRDTVGALGVLRHRSWPSELALCAQAVDQQAALAGAGCVAPGRMKATYGTGVFVLAHAGSEIPEPRADLMTIVAWRIDGANTYAVEGGVLAAGAMLEWLCRELGLAADPAALGELARSVDGCDGVRVLPALSGLGAPWWRPNAHAVLAGVHAGTRRGHVARAALEGICWRVADIVAAIGDPPGGTALRVDGGLTNEPLLLALQADAVGVPVEAGSSDATVAGIAALAAVGAGVLPSLEAAAALLRVDRRVTPTRDARWRAREHAAWRDFVTAASGL